MNGFVYCGLSMSTVENFCLQLGGSVFWSYGTLDVRITFKLSLTTGVFCDFVDWQMDQSEDSSPTDLW